MIDMLEAKPKTAASVRRISLIAVLAAATAIGLGAVTLPDDGSTTAPAAHAVPHAPGVSYTLILPRAAEGQ